MTINEFTQINNLRPADAILMRKKFFGMLDHYVIYLGVINGRHTFVANYTKGVKIIPDHELTQFLKVLEPKSIDRFPGAEWQRPAAVQRAISRIGENKYTYLDNNCEHFKNWVHYGENKSKQAENFRAGVGAAAVLGAIALLFSAIAEE